VAGKFLSHLNWSCEEEESPLSNAVGHNLSSVPMIGKSIERTLVEPDEPRY
jgi:hypothetical protein